ncbi:MAG: hypothetical protein HRT57_09005 [Crocinitomicaceae bacterium]|nr:hypothetical protein [Crocinitomicaceae bacterium]
MRCEYSFNNGDLYAGSTLGTEDGTLDIARFTSPNGIVRMQLEILSISQNTVVKI